MYNKAKANSKAVERRDNMKKVTPKNFSTTNNGIFQGWGTSICWWGHRVGYSDELSEKAAELFFSEKGLGLNIMRYNIGGGDDPSHNHIKRSDSAIPGYLELNKETGKKVWNYDADRNQLNVLKRCYKAAGKDAWVEVFSNSPPYFMTVSGCSSGGITGKENNLKAECVTEFAEYLAHVADYIEKDCKIKLKSVAPMNEPNTDYWKLNSPKQEGCHLDPGKMQSEVIVATRKAFDSKGLSHIIVAGSDETSTSRQVTAYKKYTDEAKKALGRISTHTYMVHRMKTLSDLRKKEGFNLWQSETDWSGTAGENAGDMASGLWFAKKIIKDINGLSPSAWIMWLTIDLHRSKDGYGGNPDYGNFDETKGFWGLTCCDHDKKEIILTQKYYSCGQFSRYIRPGMTLIHIDKLNLGAYDKENQKVVIVAVNPTAKNKKVEYSLSDFGKVGDTAEVIVTSGNTANGKKWQKEKNITISDKTLKATLEPNSVTTFITQNTSI